MIWTETTQLGLPVMKWEPIHSKGLIHPGFKWQAEWISHKFHSMSRGRHSHWECQQAIRYAQKFLWRLSPIPAPISAEHPTLVLGSRFGCSSRIQSCSTLGCEGKKSYFDHVRFSQRNQFAKPISLEKESFAFRKQEGRLSASRLRSTAVCVPGEN